MSKDYILISGLVLALGYIVFGALEQVGPLSIIPEFSEIQGATQGAPAPPDFSAKFVEAN